MTHAKVSGRFVSESHALRRETNERFGFTPKLIVDSGAFAKNHSPLTEWELFERYAQMAADYGIVNDVLGDSEKTLANCSKALREYQKSRRTFKLVGVAQGRCLDEYLTCYNELARMGYGHIAVGGLLQKKPNSVRFTQVRSEEFMQQVLRGIRSEFDPDWLYVLGAYHPRRHESFDAMGVWGSDYKGWLFKYPSIFQGFLTLSDAASEPFLTSREIKKIKRTQSMIGKYRHCDLHDRASIRKKVHAFHAELWRSESIISLLRKKELPKYDHRILKAVFYQSLTTRREAGILRHLRTEVFPAVKASCLFDKENATVGH
jgi:hypothetical protein